jgi:hypothetical protein
LGGCRGDSKEEIRAGETSQDISYDENIVSSVLILFLYCRKMDISLITTGKNSVAESFERDIRGSKSAGIKF